MWRTGRLAQLLGVDRSVIHYYNTVGIIHAKKDDNNYLSYDMPDFIALCKARQLRGMGFSLEETAALLHHADGDAWQDAFARREQEIDREIHRLERTRYLLQSHQGKHRPMPMEFYVIREFDYGGYYYMPLENAKEAEELAALVKDAPYVNYCFRVPEGGCTDPSRFAIEMGISFQEWWRDLTPDVLPAGMTHYGGRRALVTRIELGDEPLFTYEQLDFVREHCAREGLRLTGEVMVFPRISFLEQEEELISANLFFFLDC